MDFSNALCLMKEGYALYRKSKGNNTKVMFFDDGTTNARGLKSDPFLYIEYKEDVFNKAGEIEHDKIVTATFNASQDDVLSDDWVVAKGFVRKKFSRENEYKIITKNDSDFENPIFGYKHLMRLAPFADIPEGFQTIVEIKGRSVFDDSGKLLPKFMALKRFCTD